MKSLVVALSLLLSCQAVNADPTKPIAATMWYVVFNEPSECVQAPSLDTKCGPLDVFGQAFLDSMAADSPDPTLIAPNAAAEIGVMWAAGGFADASSGKLSMTAGLYRTTNETLTLDANIDPLGFARGWTSPDAEVHLVIRSHGNLVESTDLTQQITNFLDQYCDDPLLLYEGEDSTGNVCVDIQDVLIAPGASGEFSMQVFGTGVDIQDSRVVVNRRGTDGIQFIVETLVEVPDSSTSQQETVSEGVQALSLWWVFFNSPDNCVHSPSMETKCGPLDVFGQPFVDSIASGSPDPTLIAPNPQADIGVLWTAGSLSDTNGKVFMTAGVYRTESNLTLDANVDPFGLGTGFTNSDAEVHLILRSHGDAVGNDGYLAQISNLLDPYCDDPLLLYEGDEAAGNICSDIQDALYAPGASGESVMYVFGTDEVIEGSNVVFNRRGDLLQAVVETKVTSESMEETTSGASRMNSNLIGGFIVGLVSFML